MQTDEAGIYAIGDVTKAPWLAHKASHEGIIAAETIAGIKTHPINYNNIAGCTYSFPQIASVGLTEEAAKKAGYQIQAFDDIYEEHSKEAKEYNKNLNEALKAINENRAIDAETKKQLEKSLEQIAKTRKRWKAIELAKKTADKEGIYHKENIARIRKERSNCLPHEEQNLINKEEVHVKSLSKTQIVNKQYDGLVADKELYAQNISLGLSKAKRREEKAIFLMEAAAFKEIHGVSHEEVIKGSNNQEMDSGSDQLQPEGDIQHIRFTAANQYSHEDQKKLATAGKEAKSPIKDPVKQASTLKPIAPNKGKIGR
ncbi:unnamed protein product, partial [Rotaria sordida]